MANMYLSGIQDLGDGTITWGTTAVNMRLLKAAYSFAETHTTITDCDAGQLSQGDKIQDIDNEGTTVDSGNHWVEFDCDDETFASLASGDTPTQFVLAKNSSGELLCRCALTSPPAPNGGDYTIVIHADGAFKIAQA